MDKSRRRRTADNDEFYRLLDKAPFGAPRLTELTCRQAAAAGATC